ADTVALAVKTDEVSVLLPDSEERDFVAVAGQPMRLPGHSILVWWLRERQEILSQKEIEAYPQFQALTAQERVLQARTLVDTWVPMVTREGLRGILALGRKLSDQDYSAEEMSMLRVVARQMADSLDIARMYDLKDKRLREQALLTRLSTIVSSEPDLNKVYSLFIEEMRSSIPLDQAEITLEEKANDAETTVFSWTSPGTASGQMKSEARLALPTKGGLLGHLGMASVAQDAYPKDTNRLLEQIAFQLSIAIDNARLYDLERQARRELEQEFRERTEFVDALIHEVKTPITAMQASSELLREELAGHPSILGELAANMDASVKNLDRRISELVEFVRLQNTEIRLRTVRVPVKSLVDVAAVAIGPLLHTKGQTLRIHVDPCLGEVRADPERVSQVLLNLLTNAAKFSGPNTLVSLRVFSKDESVVFQLRDEAPPLQEEERERLFKPYQRGQKKGGGLGLGLFICRKLVQLHGGQMWSETDAEGNKFCFSLPDTEEEEEE
ncbi:MAG: GAF domain-containing protein, partial [Chloroflexi bacterium]|nr:GAF domain-containing protein [Chloroflexota bacterium]